LKIILTILSADKNTQKRPIILDMSLHYV